MQTKHAYAVTRELLHFALGRSSANDEYQGRRNHYGGWNIAGAGVDGRRDGRRESGIQHALDAETELRHYSPQRIDHRGYPRVGGTSQRQALLDGAQAGLLQVLIGTG